MDGLPQAILLLGILFPFKLVNREGGLFEFADEGNTAQSAIVCDPMFGDAEQGIFFNFPGVICFPVGANYSEGVDL